MKLEALVKVALNSYELSQDTRGEKILRDAFIGRMANNPNSLTRVERLLANNVSLNDSDRIKKHRLKRFITNPKLMTLTSLAGGLALIPPTPIHMGKATTDARIAITSGLVLSTPLALNRYRSNYAAKNLSKIIR